MAQRLTQMNAEWNRDFAQAFGPTALEQTELEFIAKHLREARCNSIQEARHYYVAHLNNQPMQASIDEQNRMIEQENAQAVQYRAMHAAETDAANRVILQNQRRIEWKADYAVAARGTEVAAPRPRE